MTNPSDPAARTARTYCMSLGLDPDEPVWGRTLMDGVHHWFRMLRRQWYVGAELEGHHVEK